MKEHGRLDMDSDRESGRQDDHDQDQVAPRQEQRMFRVMQMASSTPEHRAMYQADPVAYLQRMGIDTRGMDAGKLSFDKETLARLDTGEERLHFTITTYSMTMNTLSRDPSGLTQPTGASFTPPNTGATISTQSTPSILTMSPAPTVTVSAGGGGGG